MYLTLKFVHISFAILSIAGFALRGFWMFRQSTNLDRAVVRIAPPVVDSVFLITGIWLLVLLQLNVAEQSWLIAKFVALVVYIVLGVIALRRGRTMQIRTAAFAAAVATYLYIAGAALNKSPASWMAFVAD